MKFEKIFYVIISTVIITAFILIGYVSSPLSNRQNSSVKKLYFVDNISSAHQKIIDLFNKKYAGQIEVEAINTPFDKFSTNERKELIARYLRSNSDRIDIFAVDQIWVPRFAKWSVPLDKFIDSVNRRNLLSYALQSCIYNGSFVAIPLYIDISMLYYRSDILATLPNYNTIQKKLYESITWEDFIKLHKESGNSQNPFYTFPGDNYEGFICLFAEMMASLGKPIAEKDKLNIDSPEAEKCLNLLVAMVNEYGMAPKDVVRFRESSANNYYVEKNGIFLRDWSSFDKIPDKNKLIDKNLIAKVPPPHFKDGRKVSVFGGWNLMISKYSTKVPEAITFLNFIMQKDVQKILYEEGNFLPINNQLYDDSVFTSRHTDLKYFRQMFTLGYHRPFLENYTTISDILSYYLNLALRQKMPVKEALKKANSKIEAERITIK